MTATASVDWSTPSFDQDSLDIENYLLRSSFWGSLVGRRGRIQPAKVHSCSRELMIVTSGKLTEEAPITDDATSVIGVPLKVEDRLPAPDVSPVENGHRIQRTLNNHPELRRLRMT